MANKNMPKEVLNKIKAKTGKTISEQEVKRLASTVKPSTMKNEAQLRQLIKQVANMAKVPVSESTTKELIHAIKTSKISEKNLEQLVKMMTKK